MIPHAFPLTRQNFFSRVQQNADLDRDSLTAVSTGGVKYSRSGPLHRQCSTACFGSSERLRLVAVRGRVDRKTLRVCLRLIPRSVLVE